MAQGSTLDVYETFTFIFPFQEFFMDGEEYPSEVTARRPAWLVYDEIQVVIDFQELRKTRSKRGRMRRWRSRPPRTKKERNDRN